jgi:hypothetical protein
MNTQTDQSVSEQPVPAFIIIRKEIALVIWVISLLLGALSLYVYFSTPSMPSPDSAGETLAYNLIFFPVFITALFINICSFVCLIGYWFLSKYFSLKLRLVLAIPVVLLLLPVSFQFWMTILIFVYSMFELLVMGFMSIAK